MMVIAAEVSVLVANSASIGLSQKSATEPRKAWFAFAALRSFRLSRDFPHIHRLATLFRNCLQDPALSNVYPNRNLLCMEPLHSSVASVIGMRPRDPLHHPRRIRSRANRVTKSARRRGANGMSPGRRFLIWLATHRCASRVEINEADRFSEGNTAVRTKWVRTGRRF